jgi:hypothetical protein
VNKREFSKVSPAVCRSGRSSDTDPKEYVSPDGEIIEVAGTSLTPYQRAKSELAAFKFRLIETVAADPRLSGAPCTQAIIVFLSFVTIDKRTLKPTTVYASNNTLMARGSIKSKTTAGLTRRLLTANNYLVLVGHTKEGCAIFRVENPHFERIQMHVKEAEEYFARREAERKEVERRKKGAAKSKGVPVIVTPQDGRGTSNCSDRVPDIGTNYLRVNLSDISSEGRDRSKAGSAAGDNPNVPFPVPDNEEELEAMLAALVKGMSPAVVGYFRQKFLSRQLTPAMVEEQRRLAS